MSDANSNLAQLLARLATAQPFAQGRGAGVRVGVLDSGVDPAALAAVGYAGPPLHEAVFRLQAGQVARLSAAPAQRNPHGSAVAEIIARLAPEAEIISADVLDATGRGGLELMLAGLDWLLSVGCRVINVSLGLTPQELPRADQRWRIAERAERAYFADCLLVAAAHNFHEHGVGALPAQLASVIAVNKALLGEPEQFAYQPNRSVEFAAHARSASPGYARQAATSFAAPHITGLLARLLSRHPYLKPFEVKTILYRCGQSTRPASR